MRASRHRTTVLSHTHAGRRRAEIVVRATAAATAAAPMKATATAATATEAIPRHGVPEGGGGDDKRAPAAAATAAQRLLRKMAARWTASPPPLSASNILSPPPEAPSSPPANHRQRRQCLTSGITNSVSQFRQLFDLIGNEPALCPLARFTADVGTGWSVNPPRADWAV